MTVVVGPPNCGKSTFIGYYLNQVCKPTLYLELDCGQPNYTIPGTLSLLEVSCEKSIHPQVKVIKQFYYNSADPAHDPDLY